MKKTIITFIIFSISIFGIQVLALEGESWGEYGTSPISVLDTIADKANDDYRIQDTKLDGVTDMQGSYPRYYKIANTLDYIKQNISPYIQWMVYIGLSVAVILVIYNGLLMVTNATHDEGTMEKVKGNLVNIGIGVLVLTGFYAIIRIVVALMSAIFGVSGGGTGF